MFFNFFFMSYICCVRSGTIFFGVRKYLKPIFSIVLTNWHSFYSSLFISNAHHDLNSSLEFKIFFFFHFKRCDQAKYINSNGLHTESENVVNWNYKNEKKNIINLKTRKFIFLDFSVFQNFLSFLPTLFDFFHRPDPSYWV